MYVCGNDAGTLGVAVGIPTLYQIAVSSAGVLGAVTTGPALTTAASECSPVVEFYNPNAAGGAKDWIFLSVQSFGQTAATINCPTKMFTLQPAHVPADIGCIMSFDVTSGAAISTATATNATFFAPGGASGVIVDNSVAPAALGTGTPTSPERTSQVYYTPLANGPCGEIEALQGGLPGIGGCLVQASQAGFQ